MFILSFVGWLMLAELVILLIAMRIDSGLLATTSLIVIGSIYGYMDRSLVNYVIENPGVILMYVAGYFFIGLLWSISKWYLLLSNIRQIYNNVRLNSSGTIQQLKNSLRNVEWPAPFCIGKRFNLDDTPESVRQMVIPKANDYKADLVFWLSYWPISIIWFVLHDMIETVCRRIFEACKEIYNKISVHVFKDVQF